VDGHSVKVEVTQPSVFGEGLQAGQGRKQETRGTMNVDSGLGDTPVSRYTRMKGSKEGHFVPRSSNKVQLHRVAPLALTHRQHHRDPLADLPT
jgi:hypothetical protein